jgi:hypothetical protein
LTASRTANSNQNRRKKPSTAATGPVRHGHPAAPNQTKPNHQPEAPNAPPPSTRASRDATRRAGPAAPSAPRHTRAALPFPHIIPHANIARTHRSATAGYISTL